MPSSATSCSSPSFPGNDESVGKWGCTSPLMLLLFFFFRCYASQQLSMSISFVVLHCPSLFGSNLTHRHGFPVCLRILTSLCIWSLPFTFRSEVFCAFLTTQDHVVASADHVQTNVDKLISKLVRQRKVPTKEVELAPGNQHVESLMVFDGMPMALCWSFKTKQHDIGFSVRHQESGNIVVTYSRVQVCEILLLAFLSC